MEEDIILKSVNYQIDEIIHYCLNKKEITATECVLLKRGLLLSFEQQQEQIKILKARNKELEQKYNEESEENLKMSECLVEKQKKIEDQEKMIDLMAMDLYELYKQYPGTIDHFYKHKICIYEDCDNMNREVNCDYCFKEYFQKKASEEK